MAKQTYYIDMATHNISRNKHEGNDQFVIYATDEEIHQLRSILNAMDDENWTSFFRAHIPFVQYHQDSSNHNYDQHFLTAIRLIHELGDEETRTHIHSMGINERHFF